MKKMRFGRMAAVVMVGVMSFSLLPMDYVSAANDIASEKSNDDVFDDSIVEEAVNSKTDPGIKNTGVITGDCGENVSFTLDLDEGKLEITGNGDMADYEQLSESPFYPYSDRIKSIDIGEGVTKIGHSAFIFCFGLRKVQLPDSLKEIGTYAFLGCGMLDRLVIPDGVTAIGDHALGYSCDNGRGGSYTPERMKWFTSSAAAEEYLDDDSKRYITVYDSTVKSGTWRGDFKWTYDYITRVLTIEGDGDLPEIDSKVNEDADFKNDALSIIVKDGITGLSQNALYDFGKVREVKLPNGITTIGNYAFYRCEALREIQLPSSLTKIGSYVFSGCSNLESLTIPENVTSIGNDILTNCYMLEKIAVDSDNGKYVVKDGIMYSNDMKKILCIPALLKRNTIVIPNTVTSIPNKSIINCVYVKNVVFLGAAPSYFTKNYQSGFSGNVYYNSSTTGWTESLLGWEGVNFIDTKDMTDEETLSISFETKQLKAGQTEKLTCCIDPQMMFDVVWTSSNDDVACVTESGVVIAVSPGEATITVQVGKMKADISLIITKAAENEAGAKAFDKDLAWGICGGSQGISEKLGGIYIVKSKEIGFYSLNTGEYTALFSYPSLKSTFVNDNKLYVASSFYYDCGMVDVIDMNTAKLINRVFVKEFNLNGVGGDYNGRIYLGGVYTECTADDYIIMINDKGEILDSLPIGTNLFEFSGFSKEGGCFYYETNYNYYSWGYDHPGTALQMGLITGDKLASISVQSGFLESGLISRTINGIDYLCQQYYLDHTKSAEMFDGKFIVDTSVLNGLINVYKTPTETSNDLVKMLSVSRKAGEGSTSDYTDNGSVGVRAVYNAGRNSMIIYENEKNISEYDLSSKDIISTAVSSYNVFNMMKMGDKVILIEKDENNYYTEVLDWSEPENISIIGKETMVVGENQQLTINQDKGYELKASWMVDDNKVISITKEGKVSAWKSGTARVTATLPGGKTTSLDITVSAGSVVTPETAVIKTDGTKSNNISANTYSVYGSTVKSYLENNSDGSLTRVEYIRDKGVVIEEYDETLAVVDTKIIEMELPIFGGCYFGENANFVVFGQKNEAESDETEVVRIVKYDKNWNRVAQASVNGANTYIPFDAGSLRMDETGTGILYIHTCHEMYASSDGYHHQANMTFVLDEVTMEIKDSYFNVMNISQAGYVSHSFNQFVKTDGEFTFRVDHGDANPRAVTLTRCRVDGSITKVSYCYALSIGTNGNNATGVSVGGLELSSDNCLVVANAVDQSQSSTAGTRNIYLFVAKKDLTKTKKNWLTEYAQDSGVKIGTPQLVKINNEQFIIMWEEEDTNNNVSCKLVAVDGDGNAVSDIISTKLRLSDCKPIVTPDGLVKWYVTDNKKISFCSVNPYDLSAIKGEVVSVDETGDGENTGTENGDGENTGTENGDGENTGTENGDGENTETENGDGENTGTENGDGENTGTENGDGDNTGTENGDGDNTGTENGNGVNTGTENGNGDNTGTGNGGNTGTGNGGNTGTGTGGNTGTGNGGNTGTGTGGNTGTGNGGNTGTGTGGNSSLTMGGNTSTVSRQTSADQDNTDSYRVVGSYLCDSEGVVTYKIVTGSKLEFVGGNNAVGDVVIPDKINVGDVTYNITSIAPGTFMNNGNITSVSFGDNIEDIGQNAFYNCKKLTKVVIPKGVKKIGKSAFEGCKYLKKITIKSTKLKSVGKRAIKGINKKAVIKVPKKKLKKYKKLFNSKTGYKKSMKIKK